MGVHTPGRVYSCNVVQRRTGLQRRVLCSQLLHLVHVHRPPPRLDSPDAVVHAGRTCCGGKGCLASGFTASKGCGGGARQPGAARGSVEDAATARRKLASECAPRPVRTDRMRTHGDVHSAMAASFIRATSSAFWSDSSRRWCAFSTWSRCLCARSATAASAAALRSPAVWRAGRGAGRGARGEVPYGAAREVQRSG